MASAGVSRLPQTERNTAEHHQGCRQIDNDVNRITAVKSGIQPDFGKINQPGEVWPGSPS